MDRYTDPANITCLCLKGCCSMLGATLSENGKLHEWDDFCNARFVFNHFLIDATHVPSVELVSTVGIYCSVTHLKKLQFLLVQLYLER